MQRSLLPSAFGAPEDRKIVTDNPQLGDLRNNGGPTSTRCATLYHRLLARARCRCLPPCSLGRDCLGGDCVRLHSLNACAPTPRMLLPGSPAIDAGDASLLGANNVLDQRGAARVAGSVPDLGAVEDAWGGGRSMRYGRRPLHVP